jgi:hypothetical protein
MTLLISPPLLHSMCLLRNTTLSKSFFKLGIESTGEPSDSIPTLFKPRKRPSRAFAVRIVLNPSPLVQDAPNWQNNAHFGLSVRRLPLLISESDLHMPGEGLAFLFFVLNTSIVETI